MLIQRSRIRGSTAPIFAGILTFGVLLAVAGCGNSGPARYHVKGSVDFAGSPVPYGTITFEPDAGNSGPQGFAEIEDGEYDTSKNKGLGVIPGKVIVKISGFKTKPPANANNDDPKPALFQDYVKKIELPAEPSTEDFDIPQTASAPQGNAAPANQGP